MEIGILGAPPGISEGRVLVTPRQAGVLEQAGVRVFFERGAGDRSGFFDADYAAEGAIPLSRRDIFGRCDVLLSAARPTLDDGLALRAGAAIMGFFHLDVAPDDLRAALAERHAVAVGLERTRSDDGSFPFLERMAEVAGVVCMQLASRLLMGTPGRGVLLGGITGVPAATVVVVGAGHLGRSAARAFAGAGASVLVLDRDLAALRAVESEKLRHVQTLLAGPAEIADAASYADVLVGAVRVAGAPPPKILAPEQGRPGAVWLDLSIDEGGCIHGSRPVYSAEEAYEVEGVICCPVPNLASWAARTASRAGAAMLFPALLRAAERGKFDVRDEPWLAAGCTR